MGCVASKKAVSITPAADSSGILRSRRESSGRHRAPPDKKGEAERRDGRDSGRTGSDAARTLSFRLGNLHRYIEGEQVAAGWPAWLSAVAGEAIQGWVPLKADSFEKLEKIGQGTYSSVFRARDLDTGKIVALKKVRFDNFEPESIRFMAREIQILRKLNHPNIVKLEGLITSRSSYSLYLVFEYMEHDLAGMSSSPDITFTESQIKCYMQQLLSGLEHCHKCGIIHRDIKGANLLVNNEGILKMADFGLANFCSPDRKQPLTSRVVTLWYRPPELLLGSIDYEATVDLWSVGCVFAEMFLGKPILQGRTEVEQLHKIFKLCGSPSEEYWRKSKLPHATIFKPHRPYECHLQETFGSLPPSALGLLGTLLSVEPCKRGTALTALASEYFRTKPYACEPSSLPKYPPNKEIDARSREESRRRKVSSKGHGSEATRRPSRIYRPSQEPSGLNKLAAHQEETRMNTPVVDNDDVKLELPRMNGDTRLFVDLHPMPKINRPDEGRHVKHISQGDIPFSGPLHATASTGLAWIKKQKDDHPLVRADSKSSSRSRDSAVIGPLNVLKAKNSFDLRRQVNGDGIHEKHATSGREPYRRAKHVMLKKGSQLEHPDSFDASDKYHSQDLSEILYVKDCVSSKQSFLDYQGEGDRVEYSGPLLSQSHKVDELLQQRERHIRQAVRRSWFHRVAGRKQGK